MSKRSVLFVPLAGLLATAALPGLPVQAQVRFLRGDATDSGEINISDPILIFTYLFLGGVEPHCLSATDADDSGGRAPNLTDGIYLLNFLFLGGSPPPEPFPACGEDPTPDELTCNTSACDPLSLSATGVSPQGTEVLLASVEIVNNGSAAAGDVRVTAIVLSDGVVTSPLPVDLGTIAPNGTAVVHAQLSGGPFLPGSSHVLTVRGTYTVGDGVFTLVAELLVPPAAPGSAFLREATAAPRQVSGAPFPPQPRRRGGRNPAGWTAPTAPLVPGEPTPTPTMTENAGDGGGVGPGSVVFLGNNGLGINGSTTAEPSGASGGGVVFVSANWFSAFSTDGGATFTELDPTTIFPSDAVGFCCDQIVQYAPSINRFIWLLQGNGYRLAAASPADIISSSGTAWTYWNLTPGVFGGCSGFDYPDLPDVEHSRWPGLALQEL